YAAAFAQYGASISSNDTRTLLTLWEEWQTTVGVWNSGAAGLGGWSLSAHHVYDPGGQRLYRGDGEQGNASATRLNNVIGTCAGTGSNGCNGDLGPATAATLFNPVGVATAADGSLYIADVNNFVIRRVTPDGVIKTVAGMPHLGCHGDVTPATQTPIN